MSGGRQQFRDIDRNAIAVHDHRSLGHRQVVRKNADCVFLGGIQLDDRAAAKPQHLMNRHGRGAKHHGDVDGDLVECGKRRSFTLEPYVLGGKELPWAWPKDGRRATLEDAGISLAQQYKAQGLNMLHEHAHYFDDRSVSVEAGLMDMLTRMQTGRFKVFKSHNDWWEEFRLYHRKDGKAVAESDERHTLRADVAEICLD